VKLGDLSEGLGRFEDAQGLAVSLSDEAAQSAISKAIVDLKKKIEDGMAYSYLNSLLLFETINSYQKVLLL